MSEDKKTAKATVPATQEAHALATPSKYIGIPGLENIPMSILPIPFIKLVHGTSRNVFLKDGKKANPGTFYHTDTKEVEDELNFALINSKFQKRMVENEKTHKMEQKESLNILGYDLNSKELFVISLSALSAWRTFGSLMAQIRKAKLRAAWEYYVNLKSTIVTSKAGDEFQAPLFELGDRIAPEDIKACEKAYAEYGAVLDRNIDDSEDAVEVEAAPVQKGKTEVDPATVDPATVDPDPGAGSGISDEETVDPEDIPF